MKPSGCVPVARGASHYSPHASPLFPIDSQSRQVRCRMLVGLNGLWTRRGAKRFVRLHSRIGGMTFFCRRYAAGGRCGRQRRCLPTSYSLSLLEGDRPQTPHSSTQSKYTDLSNAGVVAPTNLLRSLWIQPQKN